MDVLHYTITFEFIDKSLYTKNNFEQRLTVYYMFVTFSNLFFCKYVGLKQHRTYHIITHRLGKNFMVW